MRPPQGEPASRFTVPICPSTNNLFRGRRWRTEEYKNWQRGAGWHVVAQRPPAVGGRLAVLIEAPLPKTRDLDNLKAVLDLAVTLHLIEDDNRVDWLCITRGQGEHITVSIWPLA